MKSPWNDFCTAVKHVLGAVFKFQLLLVFSTFEWLVVQPTLLCFTTSFKLVCFILTDQYWILGITFIVLCLKVLILASWWVHSELLSQNNYCQHWCKSLTGMVPRSNISWLLKFRCRSYSALWTKYYQIFCNTYLLLNSLTSS